jgi:hypothetical protein
MKFLQIVILAAVLVASAHALKCFQLDDTDKEGKSCKSVEQLDKDVTRCTLCVLSGLGYLAGGCSEETCPVKSSCSLLGGTFSECKTDDCNKCVGAASALQASAFVLIAAFVAMLF